MKHYLNVFDTWTNTLDQIPLTAPPPVQLLGGWREATVTAMWMTDKVNAWIKETKPEASPLDLLFTARDEKCYPTVIYEHPTVVGSVLIAYVQAEVGGPLPGLEPPPA